MKILLCIILVLSSFVASASVGGITLPYLINTSMCIVVAEVENSKPIKYAYQVNEKGDTTLKYEVFEEDTVTLKVTYTLKGNYGNRLRVAFNAHVLCPGSPEFPDKKTVIAFLFTNTNTNLFYPMYSIWGSIVIENQTQQEAIKNRIEEYLEIAKNSKNKSLLREWNVKRIESPWTRDEVIRELMVFKKHKGRIQKVYLSKEFYNSLNRNQKARIAKTFFELDSLTYYDLYLANYISKKDSQKLNAFLIKNLYISTSDFNRYVLMKKYVELFPNKHLQAIAEEFGKKEKGKEKEVLFQEFMAKLPLN